MLYPVKIAKPHPGNHGMPSAMGKTAGKKATPKRRRIERGAENKSSRSQTKNGKWENKNRETNYSL